MPAIKDPNALRYEDGKTLCDAWKKKPEEVKKAVAEIMTDDTLSHNEIVKRIKDAGQPTPQPEGVAREQHPL